MLKIPIETSWSKFKSITDIYAVSVSSHPKPRCNCMIPHTPARSALWIFSALISKIYNTEFIWYEKHIIANNTHKAFLYWDMLYVVAYCRPCFSICILLWSFWQYQGLTITHCMYMLGYFWSISPHIHILSQGPTMTLLMTTQSKCPNYNLLLCPLSLIAAFRTLLCSSFAALTVGQT